MLSSKRPSPWLFFALAYGWSWLFWVPAALSRLEFDEPPVPILIALGGIGPMVVAIALPFCNQPRFDIGGLHGFSGGIIFVIGLIFCIPALEIRPFNTADEKLELRTTGFYGIVRNPIYLGEILWCLGWAIMFRSAIGVALVPLWRFGLLILITIEEESLERSLGQIYLEYKKWVRGRIIPGLPI
jgi:protein-S-isoprenylcysteine O-methyltransferase Ste14